MFLFVCFQFLLYFVFHKKIEKYKNSVCFVYIGTCVSLMAIEIKFSKFYIFCNLDKHLLHFNAQLSKWALWLVFVMSTIK